VISALAQDVDAAGARAYLVGGCVRDHLLGRPVKDWDVEVFGLPADRLEELLRGHGRVHTVGRAFGVLKLTAGAIDVDVSLPRRDSKVGPGHRGIRVDGDPDMPIEEAVRRRDLTINALLWDIVAGELVDLIGGQEDLEAGLLRAVDAATFLEDPLRAVRAVQFAGRLGFRATPDLEALCRQAALDELPPERIGEEWRKLLLKGTCPSVGLALARRTDILGRLFPTLVDEPDLDAALDRIVTSHDAQAPEGRRLAVRLLPWLAATPTEDVEPVLDALSLFRLQGYPLRDRVLAAHAHLDARPTSDAALRHLATRVELGLLLEAQQAIHPDESAWEARHLRAAALGILLEPPPPLLQGRDLAALGMRPGPHMGQILKAVYDQQLDGALGSRDAALEAARELGRAHLPDGGP